MHTPGPWKWEYPSQGGYPIALLGPRDEEVIHIDSSINFNGTIELGISPGESEEDFSLIESAPDMLTALKEIMVMVRDEGPKDVPHYLGKIFCTALNAITKAEGKDHA